METFIIRLKMLYFISLCKVANPWLVFPLFPATLLISTC